MSTASIFFRSSSLPEVKKFERISIVEDILFQVCGSVPNGAIYLPEEMCVYRRHVPNSWSSNMKSSNYSKVINRKYSNKLYVSFWKEYPNLGRAIIAYLLGKNLMLFAYLIKEKDFKNILCLLGVNLGR